MADLQARIPDITDEELENALTQAKSNEELYKKQVSGIREEYKRLEDQKIRKEKLMSNNSRQTALISSQIVSEIVLIN